MLEDLLTEWSTGRLPDGSESSRFAHRWYSVAGMRSYARRIDDLGAVLSRMGIAEHICCDVALSDDGGVDVRVELTQVDGARQVQRWRPPTPIADSRKRPTDADVTLASRSTSTMDRDDAYHALGILRSRRLALLERLEAATLAGRDTSTIQTNLSDIETKIAAARSRFTTLDGGR